nr:MAG: ORF1 [Torque teno midi virus]
MPFWWNRRNKYWWGRRRFRRKKYYPKRRRRRRYTRRRHRRFGKRRRTRRRKVRRKRKAITVKQWQPDSIRLCKIKGYGDLVLGAEGTQYLCYTNERFEFTPPQYAAGGGFGVQTFTLQYLYEENIFKNNIWTASNTFTDLCRYLRAKIYLYRHQKADFIIKYNRQGPFNLTKYTYTAAHPYMLMQSRHKKILLSKLVNPKGKIWKKIIVKPPKQMISKWFFQKQFSTQNLFELTAAAASFAYPRLSCCNENRTVTIYYLNPQFFVHSTWARTIQNYYTPYDSIAETITFWYPEGKTTKSFTPIQLYKKQKTSTEKYYKSISYEDGFFSKKVLTATKVTESEQASSQQIAHLPLSAARYNPAEDNGQGNLIYLVSVVNGYYDKPTEDNLLYRGAPLWLAFYGFYSFIKKVKGSSFLPLHMFVVKSPYIKPKPSAITKDFFPIIDLNFTIGLNPYKAYISSLQKKLWYPTCEHQIETINSIVQCGPYIPKYSDDRDSNWELPYHYIFYFKWGGPETPQQQASDPNSKNIYTVPDTMQGTIQISNPLKQSTESLLHNWDLRRGLITEKAFKRMYENIETDTDFQPDSEDSPRKRPRITGELQHPTEIQKEIKTCLQELCKESTCQETPQTQEDIIQLILKQQHQQQQLKHNIVMLLQEIKHKQQMLQLTTGLLE